MSAFNSDQGNISSLCSHLMYRFLNGKLLLIPGPKNPDSLKKLDIIPSNYFTNYILI